MKDLKTYESHIHYKVLFYGSVIQINSSHQLVLISWRMNETCDISNLNKIKNFNIESLNFKIGEL